MGGTMGKMVAGFDERDREDFQSKKESFEKSQFYKSLSPRMQILSSALSESVDKYLQLIEEERQEQPNSYISESIAQSKIALLFCQTRKENIAKIYSTMNGLVNQRIAISTANSQRCQSNLNNDYTLYNDSSSDLESDDDEQQIQLAIKMSLQSEEINKIAKEEKRLRTILKLLETTNPQDLILSAEIEQEIGLDGIQMIAESFNIDEIQDKETKTMLKTYLELQRSCVFSL